MKFAEGLAKAYETKWSFINSFTVQFDIKNNLKEKSGWSDVEDGANINLHIVSIDTPQFTNQPIEVFVANRWVIQNGRDELYRFSITFRDRDKMNLYRKFLAMYHATRDDYFDHVSMTITLSKDGDWKQEIDSKLFEFKDTIIESIGQLQFNNTTENQIAEFTVNFKTVTPFLTKDNKAK